MRLKIYFSCDSASNSNEQLRIFCAASIDRCATPHRRCHHLARGLQPSLLAAARACRLIPISSWASSLSGRISRRNSETPFEEIERDGFPIQARIECLLSSDTDTGMAKTIGVAILGLADALTAWRPDLLLLIADRYEMLAPAATAPCAAHSHRAHRRRRSEPGRNRRPGAQRADQARAHSLHLDGDSAPARDRHGRRAWRVHRAGAPSLDHLRRSTLLDRAALEAKLGLSLIPPTIVAAWHPVTILRDTNAEADAFFAALAQAPGQIVFVYPNADAGGLALIDRARSLAATRAHTHVFVNLDAVTYWSLLGHADALVGNSSSGIMEAASFALPVVNVGMRQQGRERARNVIDAPAEAAAIRAALDRALQLRVPQQPCRDGQSLRRRNRGRDHRLACLPPSRSTACSIKQPVPLPDSPNRSARNDNDRAHSTLRARHYRGRDRCRHCCSAHAASQPWSGARRI